MESLMEAGKHNVPQLHLQKQGGGCAAQWAAPTPTFNFLASCFAVMLLLPRIALITCFCFAGVLTVGRPERGLSVTEPVDCSLSYILFG